MSKKEKAKVIEEHLPSIQSIIDEYKEQGQALTAEEANEIREQIREGLSTGHLDAMETVLGDDALDKAAGGLGQPTPTLQGIVKPTTGLLTAEHR